MTEEELRGALRAHGFSSLNEFLDMRDAVNKTSSEIKYKLLREEHENEELAKATEKEWGIQPMEFEQGEDAEKEEIYCTECSCFEDVVDDAREWFGALCKKDGHEAPPSMYAIQSLHNNCPLKKEVITNGQNNN